MSKRIEALDLLSFILALLIVVQHCIDLPLLCSNPFTILLNGATRLAVSLFFLTSSYFFWLKVKKAKYTFASARKVIVRWGGMYVFWTCIHLSIYKFPWYYPTWGVLWFIYALIVGNLIGYFIIRYVKNIKIIFIFIVVVFSFLIIGDEFYKLLNPNSILLHTVDKAYDIFKGISTTFIPAVGFSLLGFMFVERENVECCREKTKGMLLLLFFLLFCGETYMAFVSQSYKAYGYFVLSAPTACVVFSFFKDLAWKIPYSILLKKLSSLIYLVHILFWIYWSKMYAGSFVVGSWYYNLDRFFYVISSTVLVSLIIIIISKKIKILRRFY